MRAKILLKSLRVFFSKLREFFSRFVLKDLNDGNYFLRYDIPFYSQWESGNMVEDLLAGKATAKQDPKWKESGALSALEYEMYSWQICGLACLKMIVKAMNPEKVFKLIEVAREAERHGVYIKNNKPNTRFNLDGMFHKPFVKFIKRFGLKGKSIARVGTNYLAFLLKHNKFVIASVHGSIREEMPKDNPRKGHLVLLVGFKLIKSQVAGFYINNSSGYYARTQENHFVEISKWEKCFSGSIIKVEQC